MTEKNSFDTGFGSDALKHPQRVVFITKKTSAKVKDEVGRQLMSYPHLILREAIAFMLLTIGLVLVALVWDAPLEQLANPLVTPNPAKAPWYFLGLQELVSYSAFAGGVLTPLAVILGLLMAIPYIDRDRSDVGVWFGGSRGKPIAAITAILTLVGVPALIFLNARFGLRRFYPDAPQALIDVVNPATVTIAVIVTASLVTGVRARSWRLGAIVVFTGFVVAYIVLTTVGTVFRGPNWSWSWPWQGS